MNAATRHALSRLGLSNSPIAEIAGPLAKQSADVERERVARERQFIELASAAGGLGGGDDKNYVFVQNSPATTWTIVHGLGKKVAVTVFDTVNTQWSTTVEQPDDSTVIVRWAQPTAGYAVLN